MDPHKIGSSPVLTSIPECTTSSDDQHAATSMICLVLDKAKAANVSVTFGRSDSSKGKSKGKSEDPNDDPVQAHAAGTSGIPKVLTPQEVKAKALQMARRYNWPLATTSLPTGPPPKASSGIPIRPLATTPLPTGPVASASLQQQRLCNLADLTDVLSDVEPNDFLFLLRASQEMIAINTEATEFLNHGAAGSDAWRTVQSMALKNGVDLSLSPNGTVTAKNLSSTAERRKYRGDTQYYTLAETIQFVFAQGGSLAFALFMWNKQMT